MRVWWDEMPENVAAEVAEEGFFEILESPEAPIEPRISSLNARSRIQLRDLMPLPRAVRLHLGELAQESVQSANGHHRRTIRAVAAHGAV